MGVHDVNYDEIRRLLGAAEDEPIFILRGQDSLAPGGIARYANHARASAEGTGNPTDDWIRRVESLVGDFTEWQSLNPDKVKVPD